MSHKAFRAHHIERTGEFTLDLPIGHAFPLFSAEGERAWVPDWDPQYLNPDHPSNAPGTVFRTTHGDEETLWLILAYSPPEGRARYCRMTPGSRLGTVDVHCVAEGEGRTRVTVGYSLTSLTAAGNEVLHEMSESGYASMLKEWKSKIMGSQAGHR